MKSAERRIDGVCVLRVLVTALFFCTLFSLRTQAATDVTLGWEGIIEDDGTYYNIVEVTYGDKGTFTIDENDYPYYNYDEIRSVSYKASNERLTLDTDGTYKAVDYGKVKVTVTVKYRDYGDTQTQTVKYKYMVFINPNMDKVKLNKSELRVYVNETYYAGSVAKVKIKGSKYTFNDNDGITSLYAYSSKSTVDVEASVTDNVISLTFWGSGTSTVRVSLNGVVFKIKVKLIQVKCSTDSVLLYPGKTKTIKVKGNVLDDTKVTWKSSNKKVATVSKSGKITAKKAGNAIITATINGQVKVGCVVSVTSKTKVKVIKYAIAIAESSTYSQANRMQDGYYDCSSLVWKAYSKYGVYFGNKTYAPVAADQAKYLNSKNKLKGSCSYAQTQKMVMRAGDVIYLTGSDNGRYKGIYHTELFTGYALECFDEDGEPVVTTTWAARADGYCVAAELYGRP